MRETFEASKEQSRQRKNNAYLAVEQKTSEIAQATQTIVHTQIYSNEYEVLFA